MFTFVNGDSWIHTVCVWSLDFGVYEDIVMDFNVSMLLDL